MTAREVAYEPPCKYPLTREGARARNARGARPSSAQVAMGGLEEGAAT